MTYKISGFSSLKRIVNIIIDLSVLSAESAREKYPDFPTLAAHIARSFAEDRLFDVLPRLELQLKIVKIFDPPVRPALDPYSSTQLGILSKNFSDWEIGYFLDYPACCIRSFAEDIRYGIDAQHVKELKTMNKNTAFVSTAGFVPHSLFCKEASHRALIAFIKKEDLFPLSKLEAELAQELPHFHPEYQRKYYDVCLS